MINNLQIVKKNPQDSDEELSQYSYRDSKKMIPSKKLSKFDGFLKRFKKYENHYQSRKEDARQKSHQKNNSILQQAPVICEKSKTLACDYQSLPVYERLHNSAYKITNNANKSAEKIKTINKSFTGHTTQAKYQRSKSCEKIITTKDKSNQLLQQKFINDYQDVLRQIKGANEIINNLIGFQLNQNEFQVILLNLGFISYKILPTQKIQISPSDSELLNQIGFLLEIENDQQSLNTATLLIFLLIIQGLCPQQTFVCEDQHQLQAQQVTLQRQFLVLKYNRDNFLMQKRRDATKENITKNKFVPSISAQSNKLALRRRKSLLDKTNISDVSDATQHIIWDINSMIQKSKINQLSNKLENLQLKECQFKPVLSQITNQINAIQRGHKKAVLSPTSRLYSNIKKAPIEIKENNVQDQECTFQPKISRGAGKQSDRDKVVLDVTRSANIQKAYQKKLFKNSMLERGYSKNIKDWNQYVHNNQLQHNQKNQNSFIKQNTSLQIPKTITDQNNNGSFNTESQLNESQNPNYTHKPLLFVDVNIGDRNDRLIVYPDQNIDLVVKQFSEKHQLDKIMLESKIRNILFPISEIQNSQNYDF